MISKYILTISMLLLLLLSCNKSQNTGEGAQADIDTTVELVDPPPLNEVKIVPPPPLPKDEEIQDPGTQPPSIHEFVLVEREPAPINLDEVKRMIGYPAAAREAQIEGKVIVRILIDEQGNYLQNSVLIDPHPLLTKAVVAYVPKIKFSPAIQDGHPVKFWITLPFDFKP
jgi:TonB family protein